MAEELKISYAKGSFKIVLPKGKIIVKSQSELLKHGGIVGDNTKHLIIQCKAQPGKVVTARFTGA